MVFAIIREKNIQLAKDLNLLGLLVIICFMEIMGIRGLLAQTSKHQDKGINVLLRQSFFVLLIACELI
jgi:hypothetical protein